MNLRAPVQAFRLALAYGGDDRGYDVFGFVCCGRSSVEALINFTIAIYVRRAQIRAAKIDGANQIGTARILHHALRFSAAEHVESNRGHQHAPFDYVLRPALDI